ncbi:MAG TPA: hypothetical protein VJT84_02470 [Gaiellaceae bacterium]|nr:hypothetical protein [Gaiellaceae bacterium]
MSTSPDEIVSVLSRWLAGHLDNAAVQGPLESADRARLSHEQAEIVDELLDELAKAGPSKSGHLERTVRETLEALATG